VDTESLPPGWKPLFVNVNDNTNEVSDKTPGVTGHLGLQDTWGDRTLEVTIHSRVDTILV